MKKFQLIIVLVLAVVCESFAQQFLSPSTGFSRKKTSYITLENGTEIKGTITKLKRKKGLFKEIRIEDGTGTKHKLKPASIKYMYLSPSGLSNLVKMADFLGDAQKWNDEKLDQDLLNKGYAFFEGVNVKIKKKTMPLLLQLLNPNFSKKVKVYYDPFAKETASIGVAGVDVAGGIAKSYYIKRDIDPAAYRQKKNSYKKEFTALWDKCESMRAKEEIPWRDLPKHVVEYSECSP